MDASVVSKIQCPIAIEWPISERRLEVLKDIPGSCLKSDAFEATNIPGVKYYLGIYPNYNLKGSGGETTIYLYLVYSNDLKIEANSVVKIETANVSKTLRHTYTHTFGHGERFGKTEELFDSTKKFIVDGKLTIRMNGLLTVEKEVPKLKTEIFSNYSDSLCLDLRNQDEDKNFTIIAAGKEIMVHKCILATRSPVFAKMFTSGLKEAQENKVEINDFSFEIVEMGIKLCYHHSLATESSLDEKMKLSQFFDKYDIEPLKDDLEAYLTTEISE